MNRSSEYGFYLPQNTDPISVNDFNYNFDVIDDNMLSKNEQTLTAAQKSQVKSNLGFANQTDLDALSSNLVKLYDFTASATCSIQIAANILYRGTVKVSLPPGVTANRIKGALIRQSLDTTYQDTYNWVNVGAIKDDGVVLVAWSNALNRIINISGCLVYV